MAIPKEVFISVLDYIIDEEFANDVRILKNKDSIPELLMRARDVMMSNDLMGYDKENPTKLHPGINCEQYKKIFPLTSTYDCIYSADYDYDCLYYNLKECNNDNIGYITGIKGVIYKTKEIATISLEKYGVNKIIINKMCKTGEDMPDNVYTHIYSNELDHFVTRGLNEMFIKNGTEISFGTEAGLKLVVLDYFYNIYKNANNEECKDFINSLQKNDCPEGKSDRAKLNNAIDKIINDEEFKKHKDYKSYCAYLEQIQKLLYPPKDNQ